MARGSAEIRDMESPEPWNDTYSDMLSPSHCVPGPPANHATQHQPGPVAGQIPFGQPVVALATQPLEALPVWPHPSHAPAVPVQTAQVVQHPYNVQAMQGQGVWHAGFLTEASYTPMQVQGSVDMRDGSHDDGKYLAARAAAWWKAQQMPPDATTIVMRNIPSSYWQNQLLEEFLEHPSFDPDGFDFFYVPTCLSTCMHEGVGYINFKAPELAFEFMFEFHGYQPKKETTACLNLSVARRQGREAHLRALSGSNHRRVKNRCFMPVVRTSLQT